MAPSARRIFRQFTRASGPGEQAGDLAAAEQEVGDLLSPVGPAAIELPAEVVATEVESVDAAAREPVVSESALPDTDDRDPESEMTSEPLTPETLTPETLIPETPTAETPTAVDAVGAARARAAAAADAAIQAQIAASQARENAEYETIAVAEASRVAEEARKVEAERAARALAAAQAAALAEAAAAEDAARQVALAEAAAIAEAAAMQERAAAVAAAEAAAAEAIAAADAANEQAEAAEAEAAAQAEAEAAAQAEAQAAAQAEAQAAAQAEAGAQAAAQAQAEAAARAEAAAQAEADAQAEAAAQAEAEAQAEAAPRAEAQAEAAALSVPTATAATAAAAQAQAPLATARIEASPAQPSDVTAFLPAIDTASPSTPSGTAAGTAGGAATGAWMRGLGARGARNDDSLLTPTPAPTPLASLEGRNITAWFGDHQVLDRVSLTMEAGIITSLIGPSGCGKSTFLRILNRMHELVPSASLAGEVLLDGVDIYDPTRKLVDARKDIGMVFQKPNPFPAQSIYDNVIAGLKLTGTRASRDEKDALVETCLTKAGLWKEVKDRLRAPGAGLSGGQQQRLCIARSLAVRPRVLLMDEPCSALDPTSTRVIEETMLELAHEVTIVIVTHNMQQAQRVSQQCAFFLASQGTPGVIVEHGDTEAMFADPIDSRTYDYVNGVFG